MNLVKAIQIGALNIREAGKHMPPDTLTALKLLVEAADLIIRCRKAPFPVHSELLPGETKE